MNIFIIIGDQQHLFSFLVLFLKIYATRSVKGQSLNTQMAYAIVFCTRYFDILWNHSSLYLLVMKILFIAFSILIVYLIKYQKPYCKTYRADQDSCNYLYLVVPTFILSLFVHRQVIIFTFKKNYFIYNNISSYSYLTVYEVLWSFSVFLEAVAAIPQLIVIHKCARDSGGFVDTLNSHYVFSLGGYRAFYLLNWIYKGLYLKKHIWQYLWIAGLVQTSIYCDFFWYYLKANLEGSKMVLPI